MPEQGAVCVSLWYFFLIIAYMFLENQGVKVNLDVPENKKSISIIYASIAVLAFFWYTFFDFHAI